MKKLLLSFMAIAMMASFSNQVMAQTSANVNNNATCEIIAPIGITAGADLAFGSIIVGAGEVTVTTAGAISFTNAANDPGNQNKIVTAGVFNVTGQPSYTYAVTLPADDAANTTYDSDPMLLKSFNCVTTQTSATDNTGALNGSGVDVITVGATVTVAADQTEGSYTGLFNVTVAYN